MPIMPVPLIHDYGTWLPANIRVPVYKHVQFFCEVQPKFRRSQHPQLEECEIRPGLGYQMNKKWSVFAGYFFNPHFDKQRTNEKRLWQQVTYSRKLEDISFASRVRLEETWRKTYDGASVRIADQFRVTRKIANTSFYAIVSDEPFVNLNSPKNGPLRGFAENRLFIGVGKTVTPFARVELGYLNQYKNSRTAKPDLVNHVVLAQLSLDFTNPPVKHEYKLAGDLKTPTIAYAPQLVMPDLYSSPILFFNNAKIGDFDDASKPAYHPALAGIYASRHASM